MKADLLTQLNAARANKKPVALVTDLDTDRQGLVYIDGAAGLLNLDGDTLGTVRAALAQDLSGMMDRPGGRLFVHVFNPPERLIIVGAVHIAQALGPMASLAGYDVTIIDPRRAFATDARFPDVAMIDDWPDEAMVRLKPDSRTAIVTLTHDPKIDDPALAAALGSPAFYIGALGSKRTHATRLERLRERGFDDAAFVRIHGPIGLPIGAKSPAEIAIAIVAEMTAVRRGNVGARTGAHEAAT